mgnify:CR=1 FL=1
MKENVKIFLIALILGMAIAFFLSFKFQDQVAFAINPKVTYFYTGSYNNLNLAEEKKSNYPNSIIYNEDGIYKVIIGVYQDSNVVDLMSSYFKDKGITFYQEKLKVDSAFLSDISNYELLIKSSNISYYESINASILALFYEYLN